MHNPFFNHFFAGPDRSGCLVAPVNDFYLLDATAGDASVPEDDTPDGNTQADWRNCRYISCDAANGGGATAIIKVDYEDERGNILTEVLAISSYGIPFPLRNVKKLYQYYTGQTAITAQSYDANGQLVNGIKLRR